MNSLGRPRWVSNVHALIGNGDKAVHLSAHCVPFSYIIATVHLDLQGNLFKGEIPEEWEGLKDLETLNLADCEHIQGNFPSAVAEMKKLKYLSLHNTKLDGPIPSFLGDLKNLGKFLSSAVSTPC